MDKLKLPPLPRQSGQKKNPQTSERPQTKPQGARYLIEQNGVPVWVDSSRLSETPGTPETTSSEEAKQLASRIKQKLGIPTD